MTGTDPRALVPLPGDGVLARHGDLVLLCEAAGDTAKIDAVLGTVAAVAGEGGDGRRLGRRLATLLAGGDEDDYPSFCAFGPAAAGVAVVVHGAASVVVDAGEQSVELFGRDAVTLVDRVVNADVTAVTGGLDGVDVTPDRWSRLDAGIIRAGGFRFGGDEPQERAGANYRAAVASAARPGQQAPAVAFAATQPAPAEQAFRDEPAGQAFRDDPAGQAFRDDPAEQAPADEPAEPAPRHERDERDEPAPADEVPTAPVADLPTELHTAPARLDEDDPDAPSPIDGWAAGGPEADPYDWGTAGAEPATARATWVDDKRDERRDGWPSEDDEQQENGWRGEQGVVSPPPRRPGAEGPEPTAAYMPEFDDETGQAAVNGSQAVASSTDEHGVIEPERTEFAEAKDGDPAFDAVLLVGPDAPEVDVDGRPLPPGNTSEGGEQTAEGAVGTDPRPSVRGVRCSNDHFNDPRAETCAVCGLPLDATAEFTGPRPPLGVLVLDDGATFRLDTGYVVGREPDRDDAVANGKARALRVADPEGVVSRVHARVNLDGWEVTVIDVGSANGTHVCPPGAAAWTRIPPHTAVPITPGTRVVFGRRGFRFESSRGM